MLALFVSTLRDEQHVEQMNGRLQLILTSEKNQVKEGEMFEIYLNLSNTGNNTVNVWKMSEQISYDISFYYPNRSEVPYVCGVIQRPSLTNEFLVELSPGDYIGSTFSDSKCWNLEKGEYTLIAEYHTSVGEAITEPYWIGRVESNEVIIVVE